MTAVVFDFDGTLAETWQDIATAVNRALVDAGLPTQTTHAVRAWIGNGARRLMERASPAAEQSDARTEALVGLFKKHYRRCCLDVSELYPGIRECLDTLAGLPLAIASNKPSKLLIPMVRHFGIAPCFRLVLGGDSLAAHKPDPMVLEHVAATLGVATADLWMIGDDPIDLQAARAVGARCILCGWGPNEGERLEAVRPDHLVAHPGEIPAIVGQ